MRFLLVDGSRVRIALRASGLLRALAHSPTLTAKPDALTADYLADEGEGHVSAIFRASAIEVPRDLSISDREKMRDNLLGAEVLDASRFPTIEFRGRYAGTLDGGALTGDLTVRGSVRHVALAIRVTRAEAMFVASGSWEGKLTDLGIKPFKALLGAIKLEDWIALHVEARLAAEG
jgi:hypothetical protein